MAKDPIDTESDGHAGSVEDRVIEILSWFEKFQPAVGRANLLALVHVVNYSFSQSHVPDGMRLTPRERGMLPIPNWQAAVADDSPFEDKPTYN